MSGKGSATQKTPVEHRDSSVSDTGSDEIKVNLNVCSLCTSQAEEQITSPVQESAPLPPHDIQVMIYKRDQIRQMDSRLSQEIDHYYETHGYDVTISVPLPGNDHLSQRLCERLNTGGGGELKTYCDGAHFKPGSIAITLTISTKLQLQNLIRDMESGAFMQKLKSMIQEQLDYLRDDGEETREFGMAFEIKYPRKQLEGLGRLFDADTLPHPVEYTFCQNKSRWFWSPDGQYWFSSSVPMVTTGTWNGRKPQEEDRRLLEKLKFGTEIMTEVTPDACVICKTAQHMVVEEFYDSTLIFNLTETDLVEHVDDPSNGKNVSIRSDNGQRTRRANISGKVDDFPKFERATVARCEETDTMPVKLELPKYSCVF